MESALKSSPLASFFTRIAAAVLLTVCVTAGLDGQGNFPTPAGGNAPQVTPNRTLPKVAPPKAGAEFSAKPTVQEIFRARVFEEPLVPIGGEPGAEETAALADALLGYAKRAGPDDFSSVTVFLEKHPNSPWRAALLTDLGLEYYNTAHYSLALEAWAQAWTLAQNANDGHAKAIADRAVGELAYMYARLGRMSELEVLLKSVEGRVFLGPATERISGARQGLSNMKDRPEIAFRCGPLALHRIKLSLNPKDGGDTKIYKSASTQKGFSLPQVAELSKQVGLNYQMAFREQGGAFVVPSVVHWKVGHYAALIRQEGDRFLLQDPTFQNDVWATRQALEDETSGYFLVPSAPLPQDWRGVNANEAGSIWGKGNTCCNDPDPNGCNDPKKSEKCGKKSPCKGMAIADAHLMLVSLNIVDEPVSYSPPVGPKVDFVVTYNQREANQPSVFTYSNLGSKWTFDWLSYIKDNPLSTSADVKYYAMGGGTRTFTKFDSNTQSFASQQYDQTHLTRISASSYEMHSPDGSRKVFDQPDGATGNSRKVFLTQLIDPAGNAVTITYDSSYRVVALTDAIGQVTTIAYNNPNDIYKITRVTDPFGRFATFDYDPSGRLIRITDVIGLTSQFTYEGGGDFINSLVTPYGTNTFSKGEGGTTRWLETVFPDGERDRVEYNQSTSLGTPVSVTPAQVPTGMAAHNDYLWFRNTYYWSKTAYASTYPDYTKAKIYHWLHTADLASTAGILESTKEPLEGRVWFDYAGQSDPIIVGNTDQPTHIGRVLDDGTTQLYTYEYNDFGKLTKVLDPLGRTFSRIYSTDGIDLLEIRQTRAGNNELMVRNTYNSQHLPLTVIDAAGQKTTYTYNSRGQILTQTYPDNGVTAYTYDANGYLTAINGPLPGTNDMLTFTYDSFGRVRKKTDSTGYNVTFDYDALDRVTKITFPDATFAEFTFTRLDNTGLRDRAGRVVSFEYDNLRQPIKRTDPLGRVMRFQWCKCGQYKSFTDPLGRTTTWEHDIQGRMIGKQFADGSKISYIYENTTSRLGQRLDEQLQLTRYSYNQDNSLSAVSYSNAAVPTPAVLFTYDLNYPRATSMTDGTGTTRYEYVPLDGGSKGAGQLASVDGPLPNDTITYGYDVRGRRIATAVNGVGSTTALDAIGRITVAANALGQFTYGYDGASFRETSVTYPNGLSVTMAYQGILQDFQLQKISNKVGATPISEFIYGREATTGRVTTWSQQNGSLPPSLFNFTYDDANQVTRVTVTNGGALVSAYDYAYDPTGNRLRERVDASTNVANFNILNQIATASGGPAGALTNEWDAEQRLTAINSGNQRTEFSYDGLGRRVGIRKLINGSEISNRGFVWCDDEIWEERTGAGVVSKRFFDQGVKLETGSNRGAYYYTQDHLDSVRELTDGSGNVRARYAYDPFGRRKKLSGDLEADFGFAGMFWAGEVNLNTTKFRAYDPESGRWLSRDPLKDAELAQGPNIYLYVNNNPVNLTDPLGLQNVGPKAPPPTGPFECRDYFEEAKGLLACVGCALDIVSYTKLGGSTKGGASCRKCSVRPYWIPCPPPDPPDPNPPKCELPPGGVD